MRKATLFSLCDEDELDKPEGEFDFVSDIEEDEEESNNYSKNTLKFPTNRLSVGKPKNIAKKGPRKSKDLAIKLKMTSLASAMRSGKQKVSYKADGEKYYSETPTTSGGFTPKSTIKNKIGRRDGRRPSNSLRNSGLLSVGKNMG